ncbi:MAG: L-rhamnose mutarotase [Megasphaera sp.]|jgi:predicted TIM-barrel fold metal-dependent hydrolase/L-rhamnose mutarotase|nr:L-rhamnose mutarotase [Megasphaera sp.]MCI1248082.1 L-rhamnose mutarotase [Megasphaera sp.]
MLEIVDSHVHIWDLTTLKLPWLTACPSLQKSFSMDDVLQAYGHQKDIHFQGAVYVEVDCASSCREQEDAYIDQLHHPQILAKIGRVSHLCRTMRLPLDIVGVREPLHIDSSLPGRCLERDFIEGLEMLAAHGLIFESCNRVEELGDMYKAAAQVPQAVIVLNHCGNVQMLTPAYKKAMEELASLPNVYCKVSGFATQDKEFVCQLLDFITKTFAPSKLLYASNFPVVSLYSSFTEHLQCLRDYFGDDVDFFGKNAKKLYHINVPKRFASVIKLWPEKAEYYEHLHANPFPGVNDMIRQCGITDYRIYRRGDYLFSIMTYSGDDYEYDMKKMAASPSTLRWWQETDPCQTRIEGAGKDEWWSNMTLVYDLNKYNHK